MYFPYLTLYPISKNILMLASNYYKCKGKPKNFKFNLDNYVRPGELHYLQNGGHDLVNQEWFPWLWSRIPRSQNTGTGWRLYFDPWFKADFVKDEIVNLGICCQSIFNLNEHMRKIIEEEKVKNEWNKYRNEEIIGLHIRRGEVYLKDNPKANWGVCRSYYTIDEYMTALKSITDSKIIYLASDSNETLKYLKENYPEYTFLSNSFDSEKYYVPSGEDEFSTIEGWCSRNPDQIEFFVNSALVDLYFLGECHKFVGTIKISCYSKLAFLLACGKHRKKIQYYDMDKPGEPLRLNNGNDGLLQF